MSGVWDRLSQMVWAKIKNASLLWSFGLSQDRIAAKPARRICSVAPVSCDGNAVSKTGSDDTGPCLFGHSGHTTPAIPLFPRTLSIASSSPLLIAEEPYNGPGGRSSSAYISTESKSRNPASFVPALRETPHKRYHRRRLILTAPRQFKDGAAVGTIWGCAHDRETSKHSRRTKQREDRTCYR